MLNTLLNPALTLSERVSYFACVSVCYQNISITMITIDPLTVSNKNTQEKGPFRESEKVLRRHIKMVGFFQSGQRTLAWVAETYKQDKHRLVSSHT